MTLFAVACAGLFPLLHLGRPWLALLAVPVPEHDGPLAAVPQPADLGRLRGLDLRHGLAALLVRRPDPRPGDAARPRRRSARRQIIYGMLAMGWRGSARHWHRYETAYLLLAGPGDAARALGPHGRVASTSPSASCPAGTPRSSRRTSSPARSTPASRWCCRSRSRSARSTASKTSSPCATSRTWPRSCWRPGLIVAYGYVMEAFIGLVQRQPVRAVHDARTASSGRTGTYYWALIFCNILAPQLLWFEACARTRAVLFVVVDHRQRRHVARALRDRRHQPAPRLPAVVVGHVLRRRSGTGRRSSARSACS